jgi:hypothetical protein
LVEIPLCLYFLVDLKEVIEEVGGHDCDENPPTVPVISRRARLGLWITGANSEAVVDIQD